LHALPLIHGGRLSCSVSPLLVRIVISHNANKKAEALARFGFLLKSAY